MSGFCHEDGLPGALAWEVELDRLCSGQSGWALLQCLSMLALLRASDLSSTEQDSFLQAVARILGETYPPEAAVDELAGVAEACPLPEDDRAFLVERLRRLPAEVEAWALDCGLFEGEQVAGEEAADEQSEGGVNQVVAEASCELVRFVEGLPLDGGCFDAVARRCLAAAGRTGGLFSTPECVVDLMARIVSPNMREASSLYDPCCGAGFLLSACAATCEHAVGEPALFAQDVDPQAYALLRSRMLIASVLADEAVPLPALDVKAGDVLTGSWHSAEAPFDVVVSHAPTLLEWPGSSSAALAADARFAGAGALAPKDAADLAFVLHAYHCLAPSGVAALVVFPAPLRRGDAERTIRRYLLEQDAIDAVIQLPPRLLADSSMAASILVLRKGRAHDDVLFIDAMKEGRKSGEGNVLSAETIERIARALERREDVEGFAKNVSKGVIVRKAWSLTVADYFEAEAPKISVDLEHVKRVSAGFSDLAAIRMEKLSGILPH
ncbi:MAG: N-6 DNA methylase [Eggerthellaceae bacterium]|nr:N-6 DNA methylase [Eggerthellaceae bacterium]